MKVLIHEERLSELIKSSLALMCKTSLRYDSEVEIKGLLGITLDKTNVFLVDVKELIRSDEYGYSDDEEEEEDLDSSLHDEYIPHSQPRGSRRGSGQKKTKQKKTKKRKSKGTSMKENMTKTGLRKLSFNEIMMEDANKQDPVDMGTHTPQIEQNQVEADSDADAELDYSVVKVEKHDAVSIDNPDYSPNIDGEDNADGAGNCITDTSDFNDESVSNAKGEYPNKTNDSNVPEYMEDIKAAAALDAIVKATGEHEMKQLSPLRLSKVSSNEDKKVLVEGISFMDDGEQQPKSKKKQYQCPHCEYNSAYPSNMIRHKRKHDKHYKVTCLKCAHRFSSPSELQLHMRAMHTQIFVCQTCTKSFRSKTGLHQHKQAIHDGVRNFKCEVCLREFYSKTHYLSHMNMHTNPKVPQTFKCPNDFCKKVFKFETTYKTHVKNCTGGKAQCEECKLEVSSPQALKDHIKGAHEGNLFICACGKSYRWRGSYYNHRKFCKYASFT